MKRFKRSVLYKVNTWIKKDDFRGLYILVVFGFSNPYLTFTIPMLNNYIQCVRPKDHFYSFIC